MSHAGHIEKYGTGITENIRKMQEAHLLAPDIDLSAEFVTTIWRDNGATLAENVATSPLAENKHIIDGIVAQKVKAKMTAEE